METLSIPSGKKHFDLTTPAGKSTALGFIVGASGVILITGLSIWLNKHLKLTKESSKTITDIIAAGKHHNVAEMDVTIENTAGIQCNIPNESIDDMKIKATVGCNNKITLHVKYK